MKPPRVRARPCVERGSVDVGPSRASGIVGRSNGRGGEPAPRRLESASGGRRPSLASWQARRARLAARARLSAVARRASGSA